ncbi:MAG: hypothetical protein KAX49_13480 [Halanaerobiales bacterium]|nr:hypothetical protein [Halanaerobiales bacterium]
MPIFLVDGSRVWTDDISFIIDELYFMNANNDFFRSRLNLNNLGIMGMSMGGVASGLVCVKDSRIQAGINMDGGLLGDLINYKINKPFMFFNSERYRYYDDIFLNHVTDNGIAITVKDADHRNFSDLSIIEPNAPLIGKIDGNIMISILKSFILNFLIII